MNARDQILTSLRSNKPVKVTTPSMPFYPGDILDLTTTFREIATDCGSQVIDLPKDLSHWINTNYPAPNLVYSATKLFVGSFDKALMQQPTDLKNVDLAILEASLGVAENGSVWLSEVDCEVRVLPFIAQHLIVILPKNKIVANMHIAYQTIRIDETGFGVFIAGPSKTADIEQSLVIGAQGSRSHTIMLCD